MIGATGAGRPGFQQPQDSQSDYNAARFAFQRMMSKVATSIPVQVVAVNAPSGNAPVGTVDIQPMIHQIDGDGNTTPHGVIHNVPYQRLQGGICAVVVDPVVGDIGTALFASRDISSVKATLAPAAPQSRRTNSWSDAIYLPGILNQAPTIYVRITPQGVQIECGGQPFAVTGASQATFNCDLVANNISVSRHIHPGVQSGNSTTGAPEG